MAHNASHDSCLIVTAPFAPPPNRLQWMVLLAIPIVFVGVNLSLFGVIGRWISLALFVAANLLLWGAIAIGFYVNVYIPWSHNKAAILEETPANNDDETGREQSDSRERRSRGS